MATAFSRTLRSLDDDSFRSLVLGALLVAGLLGIWVAWFFMARIPIYEQSESVLLLSEANAVADFSPEALVWIHPGQPAQLRLDDFPWAQYGMVPATVVRVEQEIHDGLVQVEFVLQVAPGSSIPLQRDLTGTIEVEVDRIAPMTLLLRAAGQLLGVPQQPAGATNGAGTGQ